LEKNSLLETLASLSDACNKAAKEYETETDDWWNNLSYDDKLRAFYSVIKRVYDGEIKQQGSYRYVLYDVFGFGPDAYGMGMECGFMDIHNSIMTDAEKQIIDKHYETLHKEAAGKN